MTLPEGVDWYIHRLLVSEHYKVTPRDLEELNLDDLFDMHAVLDAIEAQESYVHAQTRK